MNVCQLCGALENLSLCGGCRGTWYCSKDHQRQDWKDHKVECKKTKQGTTLPTRPPDLNVCINPMLGDAGGDTTLLNVVNHVNNETKPPTNSLVDESGIQSLLIPASLQNTVGNIEVNTSDSNTKQPLSKNKQATASTVRAGEPERFHPQHCDCIECKQGSTQVLSKNVQADKKKQLKVLKKKFKPEEVNLPTISEDGPPFERYYLDHSTHKINLPSTSGATTPRLPSVTMSPRDHNPVATQTREQYLTILRSRFEVLAQYAVDCLTKYGICVLDHFMGEVTGREILKEVLRLSESGVFTQGQLVDGPSSSSNQYIRGDMITWLDGSDLQSENIHYLISCMDAVMLQAAKKLEMYKINERTKAMVACYPGKKTRYVRHVDNPHGDGRCITCIYYLNENWDVRQHGGLLKIYPEGCDRVASIEPKFDRLLFFWSDRRNPHEVEQAFRERYAITVWYYDADERARALKRFRGNTDSSERPQAVPLIDNASS